MHENPSAPTTLQRDLMKFGSRKILLFQVFFFLIISLWLDLSLWWPLWKSSCLITLEIESLVLNLVLLSSKPRLTKPWFHTFYPTHYLFQDQDLGKMIGLAKEWNELYYLETPSKSFISFLSNHHIFNKEKKTRFIN